MTPQAPIRILSVDDHPLMRQGIAANRGPPLRAGSGTGPYVDIKETEPTSGTTMVPFNADPVSLEIPTNTYPHATAKGAFEYEKTVPLSALQTAFGKKFGGRIDLEHRVVQVHGVVERPALPGSVASLGPIPSRVTIPLACGEIKRIQ